MGVTMSALCAGLLLAVAAHAQAPPAATQPAGAEAKYIIRRAATPPDLGSAWDGPDWSRANALDIAAYHKASSSHHPKTQAKLLYDDQGIYVRFHVQDRYVLSTHTELNSATCTDSAAEFFLEPVHGRGYFEFEVNCGGVFLLGFVEKGKQRLVTAEEFKQVKVYHSLPRVVSPEIKEPVTWDLAYFVPFKLLAQMMGVEKLGRERPWRANFFKVDETNSHPHYGAWQEIGDPLSFHKPERFAGIGFEGAGKE